MPRGGARPNSGPAPDPNALRRDRPSDKDGWTLLPAAGREGPAPTWPMASQEPRELELWAQIWVTPQAEAWSRLGWTLDVAMYVRLMAQAEASMDLKAASEARQWSDRLGLNPAAMLRNRWKVTADEVAPRRQTATSLTPAGRGSARERLKVVDDGAAG